MTHKLVEPGDDARAAERVLALITRYAVRFDPVDRITFYSGVVHGLDGPHRVEYVAELDQFMDEFWRKHGPQIPVAEAIAILKELEARFGRVE
jgi:hypothetical protein